METATRHSGHHGHKAHDNDFAGDLKNLKENFSQLRSDVSELIQNAVGAGHHGAGAVRDQAVDGIKHHLSALKDKTEQSRKSVEKRISDNPMTSTLVAFGVGYIVARIFNRS